MKTANPQSRAYPKVGGNTTKNSGAAQSEGRGLTAKQGITNVNAAQGPRVGTQGRAGKRAEFLSRKGEADALAKTINSAYAARQRVYQDVDFPKEGSISQDNPPRRQKR
jgi:hypothetical protein